MTISPHATPAYPAGSEKTKLKLCVLPDPAEGVTETADGGPPPDAVQDPRNAQPELRPVALWAFMKMLLAPVNAGLNVIVRPNVTLFPLNDAELPVMRHWLFWMV